MALGYIVSGDPEYRRRYREVAELRGGDRPDAWQDAGFTVEELAKLAEAKAKAGELAAIELAAMQLAETADPADAANRFRAASMLDNPAYRRANAEWIRSIGEARGMVQMRSERSARQQAEMAWLLRISIAVAGLLLVLGLRWVYRTVYAILGASPEQVHQQIAELGRGDFSQPVAVPANLHNSVMGWLSETQRQLARIDADRRSAEAKTLRLTQLYAALSQCNQAIVRCNSEAELFPQICRDAVMFGGMKWLGSACSTPAGKRWCRWRVTVAASNIWPASRSVSMPSTVTVAARPGPRCGRIRPTGARIICTIRPRRLGTSAAPNSAGGRRRHCRCTKRRAGRNAEFIRR